jgi:hypothetical protein
MPILQQSAVVKSTSPSPRSSHPMHQNATPCNIPTKRSFSLTHFNTQPAPRRPTAFPNKPMCASKAGAVSRMKESHDHGLASQIDPESCTAAREGVG